MCPVHTVQSLSWKPPDFNFQATSLDAFAVLTALVVELFLQDVAWSKDCNYRFCLNVNGCGIDVGGEGEEDICFPNRARCNWCDPTSFLLKRLLLGLTETVMWPLPWSEGHTYTCVFIQALQWGQKDFSFFPPVSSSSCIFPPTCNSRSRCDHYCLFWNNLGNLRKKRSLAYCYLASALFFLFILKDIF